jgi:hypothetical protein
MSYLTEVEVKMRASLVTEAGQKSARKILLEVPTAATSNFDVFLSHSPTEPEVLLLGVKSMLEDEGLKVYLDNYGDPGVSPISVTPVMANILRHRMRQSNTLLYIHSQYSTTSRWMPWELGFFDGLKGAVGIIPITHHQEETFRGAEYANLYPYVDVTLSGTNERKFWIRRSSDVFAPLAAWARLIETLQEHS